MKKCKLIKYKLVPKKDIEFINCQKYEFEDSSFKYILSSDLLLSCEPKIEVSDETSAKIIIETMLKSWEIESGLKYGKKVMEFIHESTEMIVEEEDDVSLDTRITVKAKITANAEVSKPLSNFPVKNNDFIVSPNIEVIWKRFEIYKEGRESLLSMAYFCLSYLESLCGNRANIVNTFKIERELLDKLGYISSEAGNLLEARKAKNNHFVDLDTQTIEWVENCILNIIKHLGRVEALTINNVEILTLSSIKV